MSMMARAWSSVLGSGLCVLLLGCSATSGGTGVGSGSSNGTGADGAGGSQPILGGTTGTGSTLNISGDGTGAGPGDPDACQSGGVEFVPKVPTVLLMVDRSGTMFKDAGGNPWSTLRDGVLE